MLNITVSDIFFIGIAALILTALVTRLGSFIGFSNAKRMTFDQKDIGKILSKCCALFPNEILKFKGDEFKRGMMIKVTTQGNKTFEGRLIGLNSQNVVCVITKNYIAADLVDNISNIIVIDDGISV